MFAQEGYSAALDVRPSRKGHGHFATHAAFLLASGGAGQPQAIAERLAKALENQAVVTFGNVELGGGFVNLTMPDGWLEEALLAVEKMFSLDDPIGFLPEDHPFFVVPFYLRRMQALLRSGRGEGQPFCCIGETERTLAWQILMGQYAVEKPASLPLRRAWLEGVCTVFERWFNGTSTGSDTVWRAVAVVLLQVAKSEPDKG